MSLQIGQRWHWKYFSYSDMIVEIVSIGNLQCDVQILQIYQSIYASDRVGEVITCNQPIKEIHNPNGGTWEYLSGQDRPSKRVLNIDQSISLFYCDSK